MIATNKEAVGLAYSLEGMLHAKRMTWEAIAQMARRIKPGMHESTAREMGLQVLQELGMERIWHPLLIRFGANTLKTFKQRSDSDPQLNENDLFFIDLGVVWDRHEGDCGATYVVGCDEEMHACAAAAKSLFDQVHDHWKTHQVAGPELYQYAEEQARAMGWMLNLEIKGHRVSDFPHAIYRAGDLGDFADCPQVGLWILEIQIAHPTRPFWRLLRRPAGLNDRQKRHQQKRQPYRLPFCSSIGLFQVSLASISCASLFCPSLPSLSTSPRISRAPSLSPISI